MGLYQDKVVVITGAGRGLGRELARYFAAEGAHVAGVGRGAEALARSMGEAGERAHAFVADLGIPEQVEATFKAIGDQFGKIDVLINNAAIYEFFRIDEGDGAQMERIVRANLLGPMLAARFATALLRKSGSGDIINISSESVRNPFAFLAAYASTKAGLETLSRGLRTELRPFGVRVMTLQLGTMATADDQTIDMDEATLQRFLEENKGAMSATGGAMQFSTVTQAITSMLSLPREASFELMELRPF